MANFTGTKFPVLPRSFTRWGIMASSPLPSHCLAHPSLHCGQNMGPWCQISTQLNWWKRQWIWKKRACSGRRTGTTSLQIGEHGVSVLDAKQQKWKRTNKDLHKVCACPFSPSAPNGKDARTTMPNPSQLARLVQLSTTMGAPLGGAMSVMLTIHNLPRTSNGCLTHSCPCPPALSHLYVALLAASKAKLGSCLERASTSTWVQITDKKGKLAPLNVP